MNTITWKLRRTQCNFNIDTDAGGVSDCQEFADKTNPGDPADDGDRDSDGDGVIDKVDNCDLTQNADQANFDGDAMGDVCDPDDDNDGVEDVRPDRCPGTALGTAVDETGCTFKLPTAVWSWSMKEKLADHNRDGMMDYPRWDVARDVANSGTVLLDGCTSISGNQGDPITQYTWVVDGKVLGGASFGCKLAVAIAELGAHKVSLTVTTGRGLVSPPAADTIKPKNYLIVSLGDSFASGEGAPDKNVVVKRITTKLGDPGWEVVTPPKWQNANCHRSAKAGPALAAREFEKADPQSTVTFVHLACSGATAEKGLFKDWTGSEKGADKRKDAKAQFDQLREVQKLRGPGAPVDALTLSIGGNDIGFSNIIKACIIAGCGSDDGGDGDTKEARRQITTLKATITDVKSCLLSHTLTACGGKKGLGIPGSRILVTNYPDLSRDENGHFEMYRPTLGSTFGAASISGKEFRWAHDYVLKELNSAINASWARYSVKVADVLQVSRRAGVTATEKRRWFNTISDAEQVEGPAECLRGCQWTRDNPMMWGEQKGAFHPNAMGQRRIYQTPILDFLKSKRVVR